jgi:hypothetical protein
MATVYDYGDFYRSKSGVAFHGWLSCHCTSGADTFSARTVEFPDGTKIHGYSYAHDVIDSDTAGAEILAGSVSSLDDGRKVGTKLTTKSIEYPDGRKIENPPPDELDALFVKNDGDDGDAIMIRALDDMTPEETTAMAACGAEVQEVVAKALAHMRAGPHCPACDKANVCVYAVPDSLLCDSCGYHGPYLCKDLPPAAELYFSRVMPVSHAMNTLLGLKVDLDDRAAVEKVLNNANGEFVATKHYPGGGSSGFRVEGNPYKDDPVYGPRFVDWVIKAAKANLPGGPRDVPGLTIGQHIPTEFGPSELSDEELKEAAADPPF